MRIFMRQRHYKLARRLLPLVPPFLLALVAGCGAMNSPVGASPAGLIINAEKTSLDTTNTAQLSARLSSGASADVKWTIAGGQNAAGLGQGTISANGAYTPPPLLSRDQVQVQVVATSRTDPTVAATYPLTLVTPRFVQVLTPETASLAPGGTLRVKGEIAEVNSGTIRWSLATTAGEIDPGDSYGSIGETSCHHSSRTYTYCTATYTAPHALPPGSPSVLWWRWRLEIPTPSRRFISC